MNQLIDIISRYNAGCHNSVYPPQTDLQFQYPVRTHIPLLTNRFDIWCKAFLMISVQQWKCLTIEESVIDILYLSGFAFKMAVAWISYFATTSRQQSLGSIIFIGDNWGTIFRERKHPNIENQFINTLLILNRQQLKQWLYYKYSAIYYTHSRWILYLTPKVRVDIEWKMLMWMHVKCFFGLFCFLSRLCGT